jgi:hypothetical protein
LEFIFARCIFVATKKCLPDWVGGNATLKTNEMVEKKESVIRFRCTASERKKIERMAKPYGSISKFMLSTVLSDKKVIIDPYTFLKGMDELTLSINRVGNNINQIAKYFHATKDTTNFGVMQELLNLYSEYNAILHKVKVKIDDIYKDK